MGDDEQIDALDEATDISAERIGASKIVQMEGIWDYLAPGCTCGTCCNGVGTDCEKSEEV